MRLNTLNVGLPENHLGAKDMLLRSKLLDLQTWYQGGDFCMPCSISPILTQAQLLNSSSPLAVGEQIFVKSSQFALPFLT